MKYHIFGIGNTLLDFLMNVDDDVLHKYGLKKGIMHLLSENKIHEIIDYCSSVKIVPAGAVTNTCSGIAALGGKAMLMGMIGNGRHGVFFEESLKKQGVASKLGKSAKSRTGKVLCLVTKDAERTFAVYLGAASELPSDSIDEMKLKDSAFLYFTGYEFESMKPTILHAVKLAKKHGTKVALDLADPELIKRHMEALEVLANDVDILFMNEREALAFTGKEPREAAIDCEKKVPIAVVKYGSGGSYIASAGKLIHIDSFKVNVVDTTGAGDLYAAGFLYSLTQGRTLESAGKMGSYMGAKIVSQMGALLDKKSVRDAKLMFESLR